MRIPLSAAVGITCLALGACGGASDKPHANEAALASFAYGSSTPATAGQAAAAQAPVASSTAFRAAPSPAAGLVLSDVGGITAALLPAAALPLVATQAPGALLQAIPPRSRALVVGAGFDNPSCATATPTSITFASCTKTVDETDVDGTVSHTVATVNGSMSYTAATNTAAWDLTLGATVTATGPSAGNGSFSIHMAGSIAVGTTAIVGHMGTELALSATISGRSVTVGVDESVDLDLTYADAATCATRVTGGTLEAKRVWTARPTGVSTAQLPDAAAKVTWTGCGQATVQYGTR